MPRTILCALAAVFLIILSLPFTLAQAVVGLWNQEAKEKIVFHYARFCLRLMEFCAGVKVTVLGEENVPWDEPVLFVGNHRSGFDIILTYARMKKPVAYIAKKELQKIPYIGYWMSLIHVLFLDREDLRQGMQVIMQAIDLVKKGFNVFIYPEGTRNKGEDDQDLLEFKEGSFRVATRTGCKIVPVAMTGSVNIFEAHFPKIYSTHVILEYGEPIDPTTLSKDEQRHLGVATRMLIGQMIHKNKALLAG